MKELIDKLSLGIIDYENPKVSVDQEEIEAVLMPGELQESSFCVIKRGFVFFFPAFENKDEYVFRRSHKDCLPGGCR